MGSAARERIEMCYSLRSTMPTMTNIILSAARSRTHWSGYNSEMRIYHELNIGVF